MTAEISYGKAQIPLYRTYAKPLAGVTPIPESPYAGRDNILFAAEIDVEVFGDNFLPAYTEGDNSMVVATDTMKNFVLRQALHYGGSTLEGFLHFLGRQFLTTYGHMAAMRVTGKEQPFDAAVVPAEGGFSLSDRLFSRSRNDQGFATLLISRQGEELAVTDQQSGRLGLQLIKVTGSAFASFARDEYTTLPERKDRPLFIYLDVFWRYGDVQDALSEGGPHFIDSEQIRDFVEVVFHDFVSMSIQHLIYEMGTRLLDRFPQLSEVSFSAQNRLWDVGFVSEENEQIKVYTDPRPPYGSIKLTLHRS